MSAVNAVNGVTPLIASRESAATKGRRYIIEGRLKVLLVHGNRVFAQCRGNGATYNLGYIKGRWWCECPARGICAHLVALQLVVDRPQADR